VDNNSEFTFFIALSKYGSLSGTARELNLTPSAVTKRLSSLEARLGVRLINRTTRKLSLTNEGELYLKSAKEISAKIYELEAALSMRKDSPSGLLKVNAPLGFGRNYISPIISEFISQYPDVQVELMLTDRPMSLPDESVDVCIQFGTVSCRHLRAHET
jgi:DNA-binding transcriptional LysR family regulator